MGDKKIIPAFVDKRLKERLLDRGEITKGAMADYLTNLPDLEGEVDFISLGGEPEESGGETA